MRLALCCLPLVAAGCIAESRIGCADDTQCTRYDPAFRCDRSRGFCVAGPLDGSVDGAPECSGPNQCTDAMKPICDGTTQTCRACQAADCTGAAPICSTTLGRCVGCETKADCASQHKTCDVPNGLCVPCVTSGDCTSGVCRPDKSCADASAVAYVDNANPACSNTMHPSSPALPYC